MSGDLAMTTAEQFLFWIVSPIVVAGASALLFAKRAVLAACSIMVTMVGLAFLYVGLGAPFLGVVQVVVYTGAIMMLFVFVLMLVGVDVSDSFIETIRGQRWLGAVFGIGLAAVLAGAVVRSTFTARAGADSARELAESGNVGGVAGLLFSDFAFTLEITGCLLVIAAMGAVIMTHRTRLTKPVTQPELMRQRAKRGLRLTPEPAPGNYARHNAADVPALDAEGRIIENSVPSALRIRGQVHTVRGLGQDLLPGGPPPLRRPDAAPPAGRLEDPPEDPPAEAPEEALVEAPVEAPEDQPEGSLEGDQTASAAVDEPGPDKGEVKP
ncbi:MAG: NADH-quinone oxidoreductase subunit J [Bifidobacteriaceae bacterium]|jgi:NADH-quinone oxidoreductase subunit J|nr:NADH-quinone oxidoreductase subunit J [Bifidobacteriaceae bacterium]